MIKTKFISKLALTLAAGMSRCRNAGSGRQRATPHATDHRDHRVAAVQPVRAMGEQAQAVADRHFFETVVRTHRAGEGARTQASNLPALRWVR